MKRKYNKRKNKDFSLNLAIVLIGIMILVCFFVGCAEPQPIIKEVKVETPCEVESIPTEPREIDLQNSSISAKMDYIKAILIYAKEIRPIMRDCVKRKKIKAKNE